MKTEDDFNWDSYTKDFYGVEMVREFVEKNIDLIVTNFIKNGDDVEFNNNLHVNWKELYYIINKLKVKSIFECGCGCGHHLINNKIVNPNLIVNGCDYSQSQIDLGIKEFNLSTYDFAENLKVFDMTSETGIDTFGKHEFVYTQAVTMHLSYDRAKKFLYNMKKLTSKYVFLIENTTVHDYDKLISEVFPEFEVIQGGKYIDYGILLKLK